MSWNYAGKPLLPFGMNHLGPWYETVAPENKYLYNGKELNGDYEINLMDYGARWYDGAIGRFYNGRSAGGKHLVFNLLAYAANNPVSNIDIFGWLRPALKTLLPVFGHKVQVHMTISWRRIDNNDEESTEGRLLPWVKA